MDPTVTDWISALAAVWTALLTAGLLLAALIAGWAAMRTLAQMRADSEGQRQDSARATRPYVHARLVPSIAGVDAWDLVVQNTGRTAAHHLVLQIDAEDVQEDIVTKAVYRFAAAGLTVHPGERIRTYWSLEASKPDRTGFPPAIVTVRYSDSEGTAYEERPVVLDPDDMGMTPVPSQGSESIPRDHQRDLVLALRGIARNIGEGNR